MVDVKIGRVPENRKLTDGNYLIDADTVRTADGSVRIADINAPETQHVIADKASWYNPFSDDKLIVKQGEFQGQEMTDEIAHLANVGGYTNVSTSGKKGVHGRDVGRLVNEYGESLGERAAYEGVTPTSQYDTDRVVALRELGTIANIGKTEDNEFDKSRKRLEKHARDNNMGWKLLAMNESELANYNNAIAQRGYQDNYGMYRQDDVEFRHKGQTVQGQAYNALFTGLEGGALNIKESFFGAASAVGDLVNSKGIYDWGRIKAIGVQDDQAELGRFINDIGDVDSAADFGRYASGMAGQMMPYLAGLFASGGIGAMVGGAGYAVTGAAISYGTPTLVYAGEIYNGMVGKAEDKNVGWAFAGGLLAATVDRLALNGLVKGGQSLVRKDGKKQLVEAYMLKFPKAGKDAAEKAVSRAYAGEQAQLMKQLGIVELNLNKSLVAKEMGKGFLTAGTREAFTEMVQEGTIYASQVQGSKKKWDQDEFVNILQNAATGGFILGGGIGGIGGAKSYGDFLDMQRQFAETDQTHEGLFFTGTTETNLKEASDAAIKEQGKNGRSKIDTANDAAAEYDKGRTSDTIRGSGLKRWISESPSLYFRKLGDKIMTKWGSHPNQKVQHILATLTSNFANTTSSTMAGMSHNKMKKMLNDAAGRKYEIIEKNLTNELGFTLDRTLIFKNKPGKSGQAKASKYLRDYMRAKDSGKAIPKYLQEHAQVLETAAIKMNMVTNEVLDIVNTQTGSKIEGQTNYFGHATRIDPKKVVSNPITFKKLTDYLGYDAKDAKIFKEQILGAPEGYQPGKMQKLGFRRNTEPGSLKEAKANIKDFPGIDALMMDNHFDQIRTITKEDINYAIDTNRLGEGGGRVDAMLMELKKEMGKDWDPRIATWIKDSIAAGRGDYRKIDSKLGNNIQQWVLWLNALTQLDTSMLASLPELAMVFYGRGKQGSIVKDIKDAAVATGADMAHRYETNKAKMFKDYNISEEQYNAAVEDFYRLGYGEAHSSAAALFSSEAEKGYGQDFREATMQAFFKLNMLQQFTDMSRIARLGLAGNAIINDLETLSALKGINNGMHFDAVGRLRDLNVNPEVMADAYATFLEDVKSTVDVSKPDAVFKELTSNPKHAELLQMFDNAKSSYVDNVLARPTHEDRPLWYSNPHYRLLTQYTGFLSTFTANTLPRLFKDLKSANPAAKFQASAAVMSMLALGFIGQGLKDEIYDRKYHEKPQGLAFYQRGLQSSGLIGTGERWLDAVNPVYGDAGILNFSSTEGLSLGDSFKAQFGPTVGTVEKWGSYLSKLAGGKDTGNGLLNLTPYGKLLSSWDSVIGTDYLKE